MYKYTQISLGIGILVTVVGILLSVTGGDSNCAIGGSSIVPSCCNDFLCLFTLVGFYSSVVVVPIFALIFGSTNAMVCHKDKSRLQQFFVGCALSFVASFVSILTGVIIYKAVDDGVMAALLSCIISIPFLAASAHYAKSPPSKK